jgi:hypothetical protein
VNADSGAPCSPRHSKKKQFIDSVKRAISQHGTSKQLTEAAAVTCVKLCKASTYINILDSNNVAFTLVQNIINELKVGNCFICSMELYTKSSRIISCMLVFGLIIEKFSTNQYFNEYSIKYHLFT